MAELIDNVLTQAAYVPALRLGPASNVAVINFSVLNQPALAQFYVPVPGYPGKYVLEGIERSYVANTFGAFATNVAGVQFRSAIPASPAQITAEMAFVNDPKVIGGTLAGVGVSSGGQVTPLPGGMVTGLVEGTGVITSGTGFTVVRNSAGNYTVTFTTPFASPPTVVVCDANVAAIFANLGGAPTVSGFNVATWTSTTGAATDGRFSFIAATTV